MMDQLLNKLQPDFVMLVLFLIALGSVLKYRTPIDNKLIPTVLFLVSFFISSARGIIYAVGPWWFDGFVMGGLVNGLAAVALAAWAWDTFYGMHKAKTKRRLAKKEEGDK